MKKQLIEIAEAHSAVVLEEKGGGGKVIHPPTHPPNHPPIHPSTHPPTLLTHSPYTYSRRRREERKRQRRRRRRR